MSDYVEVKTPPLTQTEFATRISDKKLPTDSNSTLEQRQETQLVRMLKAWAHWSNDSGEIRRLFGLGIQAPDNLTIDAPEGYDSPDYAVYAESELMWLDKIILDRDPQDIAIIQLEFFIKGKGGRKLRGCANIWAQRWGKVPKTYYNRRENLYRDLINIILLKYGHRK